MPPSRAVLLSASLIGLIGAAPACPAHAQGSRLELDLGASYSIPPSSFGLDAAPYLAGGLTSLTRIGRRGSLTARLEGGLTGAQGASDWLGANAGFSYANRIVGNTGWALFGSGEAFSVLEPGSYRSANVRVTPGLWHAAGPMTLHLRLHGGAGVTEVGAGDAAVMDDVWIGGGGGEVTWTKNRTTLRTGASVYRTAQGDYATVGLAGRLGTGVVSLSADLATWWLPGGSAELAASVGISVQAGPRLVVDAAGGRAGPDPLLGTPVSGFGVARMTWTLHASGGTPVESRPAAVLEPDRGRVRFRIEARDARAVTVAGDFSDWRVLPLEIEDGIWSVELELPPGTHRYAFKVDGVWTVPEEAEGRTLDEFGQPVAVVMVPQR